MGHPSLGANNNEAVTMCVVEVEGEGEVPPNQRLYKQLDAD